MDRQQFLSLGALGSFIASLFSGKLWAKKKQGSKQLHPGYMIYGAVVKAECRSGKQNRVHIIGGQVIIRRDLWDSLNSCRVIRTTDYGNKPVALISPYGDYVRINSGHIVMSEHDWVKLLSWCTNRSKEISITSGGFI